MKEFIIPATQNDQRLDKYLAKLLPVASKSWIYKMLRKKNIVLNGKKAEGNEHLKQGDCIKIFFSDETFTKFSLDSSREAKKQKQELEVIPQKRKKLEVIYEDENILLVNKPMGVLTQKAVSSDYSLNEQILDYLQGEKKITKESLTLYKPSVCNRLDRNTSGLVCAGITYIGSRYLNEAFKTRSLDKRYLALVSGVMKEAAQLKGYWIKDEKTNQVTISKTKQPGMTAVETYYRPLGDNGKVTLLEVELITGKSHQIRAHLASINHPIIGDSKYGKRKENEEFKKNYHLSTQLLHAFSLTFPRSSSQYEWSNQLAGQKFIASLPENYRQILSKEGLISYVNME